MSHLVVISHGFCTGSYSVKKIQSGLSEISEITILLSKVNEGFNNTSDGVITAGQRLALEIINFIESSKVKFTHISFIGSSLGGLLTRVAIGLLVDQQNSTIIGLIPVIYISLASPHLGIQETSYFHQYLGSIVTPNDETLKDLSLSDDTLTLLSDPKTVYFLGLSFFQGRYLFTNMDDDGVVNYNSGGITEVYWDLPIIYSNVKGIISDYKDSMFLSEQKETPTQIILNNLQKLSWHRVICQTGNYGLFSHAIASTGFSEYGNQIILTIIYIFMKNSSGCEKTSDKIL